MEIKTVFKTTAMAVACLGTVAFASCSDDEDNKSMKLSASKIEMGVDSTQAVAVANCTTPLTAKSSDENIATVSVDKTTLTVKGVKAGAASIVVTDANKQTATLSVNVKQMLSFDTKALSVAATKEGTVTVKSGTAPYTVVVKDTKVATATVKDAVITVKGVAAGTTTLTVVDKNQATGTVTVTVTK